MVDDLFLNESKLPSSPGPGISLTVEAAYGNTPTLNVHRKTSYFRQNYGRDNIIIPTNNNGTTHRFTYGTGSGLVTHGIPKW